MTTPTREELLALANAASKDGEHIYSNPRDHHNWKANETWHRAASPEAFIALLSAHQAQGEPEPEQLNEWHRLVISLGCMFGFETSGSAEEIGKAAADLFAARQAQPLSDQNARFAIEGAIEYGRRGINPPPTADHWLMPFWEIGRQLAAPPSSAQTDQVWNEAAEWLRNNYQDYATVADLCDAMLKRPLQAQELASPAAQSGSVDEREVFERWAADQLASYDLRKNPNNQIRYYNLRTQHTYEGFCAAVELSRAQTAPAVDLASVSDEERAAFEAWSKREGALNIMDARDAECEDGRFPATYYYASTETAWRAWANGRAALSRPSTPAPVSKHAAQQALTGEAARCIEAAAEFIQDISDAQPEIGHPELAERLRALLSQSAAPVSEQPAYTDADITAAHSAGYKLGMQQIRPAAQTAGVPDVDWLANVIREADGNHSLGAGALAEKIVEAMLATAPQPVAEQVGDSQDIGSEFISVTKRLPQAGQRIEAQSPSGAWIETFNPDEPLGNMTHWRPIADDATDSTEQLDAETISIDYQRVGRCWWHTDCSNRHGGIMRVVSNEADSSTIECLHCGKRGSYPIGSVGEVTVLAHPQAAQAKESGNE